MDRAIVTASQFFKATNRRKSSVRANVERVLG
jgi:hypothetical protein